MSDPASARIPRWIHTVFLVIGLLSLIPLAMIWRNRVAMSREPALHLFLDMTSRKSSSLRPRVSSSGTDAPCDPR